MDMAVALEVRGDGVEADATGGHDGTDGASAGHASHVMGLSATRVDRIEKDVLG